MTLYPRYAESLSAGAEAEAGGSSSVASELYITYTYMIFVKYYMMIVMVLMILISDDNNDNKGNRKLGLSHRLPDGVGTNGVFAEWLQIPYILQNVAFSAHMFPHAIICCGNLPHFATFSRESSWGELRHFSVLTLSETIDNFGSLVVCCVFFAYSTALIATTPCFLVSS